MSIEDNQHPYEITDKELNKHLDSENDEYDYEIRNTTNDNSRGYISQPFVKNQDESIDALTKEVARQESEISKLKQYKDLCERHILQLNPEQKFPVTEEQIDSIKRKEEKKDESQPLYSKDKEEIFVSLRNETLLNEEQRAYIEILKQAIESSLIQNGLEPFMQKSQSKSAQNHSGLNIMVDLSKLKLEKEKLEKEVKIHQGITLNTKSELEFYKKKADDISLANKQLKFSLDKTGKKKEEASNQITLLNNTITALIEETKTLKQNNMSLLSNTNELQLENLQFKLDLKEKDKELASLEDINKDLIAIKKQYDILLLNNQNLQTQYESLFKHNTDITITNNTLKSDLKQKLQRIKDLTLKIEETTSELSNAKESLQNELKSLQEDNKSKQSEIKYKDTQIKTLKMKEIELKRTQKELKELKQVFIEYEAKMNDKIKSLSSNLERTTSELKSNKQANLNLQSRETSKEKNLTTTNHNLRDTLNEVMILKQQNEQMALQIEEVTNHLKKETKQNTCLIDENFNIKANNNELSNEILLSKMRYNKEIVLKEDEVVELKKDICCKSFQIENIIHSYDYMVKDNELKNEEIIREDERVKRLRNEIKNLKESNCHLMNIINKHQLGKEEMRNEAKDQITELTIIRETNEVNFQSLEQQRALNPEENNICQSIDSILAMITSSFCKIEEFVLNIKKLISEDAFSSKHNEGLLSQNGISQFENCPNNITVEKTEQNKLKEEEYMKTIEWFVSMSANELETLYNNMLSLPPIKQRKEAQINQLYCITSNRPKKAIKATLDISHLKKTIASPTEIEQSTGVITHYYSQKSANNNIPNEGKQKQISHQQTIQNEMNCSHNSQSKTPRTNKGNKAKTLLADTKKKRILFKC